MVLRPGLNIASGVGSPGLAPSPTLAVPPHPHSSLPTTPNTSSSQTSANIPLAMRQSAKPGARPAALEKMTMASVLASSPQSGPSKTPLSMTSKEWVIPPRPKPGRKPATDTPPTKRKAQNRAAQRAFRERRAARVGELEEQIEEQKEETERVHREMEERIHSLELETQTLRTRCQVLENMLARERSERRKWSDDGSQDSSWINGSVSLLSAVQICSPQSSGAFSGGDGTTPAFSPATSTTNNRQHGSKHSTASTTSGSGLRNGIGTFSISQIISPPDEIGEGAPTLECDGCAPEGPCVCAEEALNDSNVGCGKCSLGTKCECLEATINAVNAATASSVSSTDLKRPHRPTSPCSVAPDEKRQRSDTAMEIDLTAMFSGKKNQEPEPQQQPSTTASPYLPPPVQQTGPPRDPCGFCEDGTYCVCADALPPVMTAAPTPAVNIPTIEHTPARQVETPPPSETDVVHALEVTATGAIKLPSFRSMRFNNSAMGPGDKTSRISSCGPGGPGTCAQCLIDPKSGLFCRSLAANLEKSGGPAGSKYDTGCCGGAGAGGGCCKTKQPGKTIRPNGVAAEKRNSGSGNNGGSLGLSLSCADTYKTLSSHRHFDEATDDIGTWLPLLRAAPRPSAAGENSADSPAPPRPAMEVEAASIMSVLKGFDVRFGS